MIFNNLIELLLLDFLISNYRVVIVHKLKSIKMLIYLVIVLFHFKYFICFLAFYLA